MGGRREETANGSEEMRKVTYKQMVGTAVQLCERATNDDDLHILNG